MAPSSLMVSPFSIAFSTMCTARAPYSAGRSRRGGNGTCFPSDTRAGSVRPGQERRVEDPWGNRAGAVEVPVAHVKPFDYQVLGAIMKVF